MENIKSYLDGELDIAQKAEVETHLHNDAELQKMVEEFSAISTTLKTADSGEPYGFEKLEERLKEGPKVAIYEKKKIWRTAINWSAGSAGVLLLAAFMFPVFAQSKDAAKRSMSAGSIRNVSGADATASASPSVDEASTMKAEVDKPASPSHQENLSASAKSKAMPGGGAGFGGNQDSFKNATEPQGQRYENKTQAQVSPENESAVREAPIANGKAPIYLKADNGRTRIADKDTQGTKGVTGSGGAPLIAPAHENDFKAGMRAKRDGVTQSIPGVPETDHGIYLERSGQMQVKVDDLKRAVNEATGMVLSFDGFVTASNTQNQADGGVATMTLRIPTKNFMPAIDKLEAMGELISENTGSLDITKPTVDNSARMISWADEEKRLIDELNKTSNNDRRYRLKQLIGQARAELESHKAEVNSLLERAKFSTLELTFVRGDKAVKAGGSSNWSGSALQGAKENLAGVGQVLGTMGIYILVFSPIWLPFAIASYVIRKKSKS